MTEQEQKWVEETTAKIYTKMEWLSVKSAHKIPYTTMEGVHDDKSFQIDGQGMDDGPSWWTNGFWAGMLWLMYHQTKEEKYADIAKYTQDRLSECLELFYGLHHDVGFMWLHTAVADYRLRGRAEGRRDGLHAATLLAGRFNPVGKFIRAWNDNPHNDTRGWAIIDCMMNIPLLYWATEETKDPRFKQIAMLHADTAMDAFIRPDGSSNHIVEFDPFHGGVVKTYGGQGYAEGSSWTRGQSWAIYGFILSYIHTQKLEYLDTAKRVANYFIANIPESGLIPVDFHQPSNPDWEDSTAAAIAACGLIEISRCVNELESPLYLEAALKLLKTLEASRCCWDKDHDNILTNCSSAYHVEDHHISIIYGDYFFMEAIFKLKGSDFLMW